MSRRSSPVIASASSGPGDFGPGDALATQIVEEMVRALGGEALLVQRLVEVVRDRLLWEQFCEILRLPIEDWPLLLRVVRLLQQRAIAPKQLGGLLALNDLVNDPAQKAELQAVRLKALFEGWDQVEDGADQRETFEILRQVMGV